MTGIDLKLTSEKATHTLGREVEDAILRIRAVGDQLAEQLSVAAKPMAIKPVDIAHAEIAAVIDFEHHYDLDGRPSMLLSFNGQSGGYVQLHNKVRKGRYRAVILIERLGDLE